MECLLLKRKEETRSGMEINKHGEAQKGREKRGRESVMERGRQREEV